ncbi:MAG TPA: TatD family hydrolase [Desulfomonilaceae bacterium]|nr:TatD family hydrolase [Desulfomonilaceae bacterium]
MNSRGYVLVDSHAHLELDPLYTQATAVVQRAFDAGVKYIVTVGIDIPDIRRALEIADRFPRVFASVGIHPHNAKDVGEHGWEQIEKAAQHAKVVAYGEIGLDFFRNLSPRDVQIRVFSYQLSLAKKLKKPVVIHLRDAYEQGLELLETAAPFYDGGVIHCFSGNELDAQRALDLGFHISVPGTVTYKKNELLRSIVAGLPEERILLETDCPFLAPEPLRGKDNEPAYMIHTAKKVAEVRNTSVEHIARITTENAKRLFKLPI